MPDGDGKNLGFIDSKKQSYSIFRRHVEIHQIALEASGLPCPVSDSRDHPDRSRDQRQVRQVNPDEKTDQEAQHRRNQLPQSAVFAANVVVGQRRQVDAHESDQRPEVEQLRAIVVADEERSQQRNHANENHIVRRNPGPGMDGSEEFFGNRVAASHAIEQARRAELRSHAGANGRNQQRDADGFGHQMCRRRSQPRG